MHSPSKTRLIFLVLTLALCAACSSWEASVGPQTVYQTAPVDKQQPAVFIRPKNPPENPPTAIMLPFKMTMRVDDSRHVSRELGRMFHQQWLSDQVLPTLIYEDAYTWSTPKAAIRLARNKGADLVMGGEITRYMVGGSAGETFISLNYYIYDAATGHLIWSFAHAGRMYPDFTQDYILFTRKMRMPAEPVNTIMYSLAHDLAEPVKEWTYGPYPAYQGP